MSRAASTTLVTVWLGEQLFGLPIGRVRDVFEVAGLTPVPLAPPEIAGLANLRGRVVTVLDLRTRIGFPPAPAVPRRIAVGIEADGESFGLLVDGAGEVLTLPDESRDDLPAHGREPWGAFASSLHRTQAGLLVALDVDALIRPDFPAALAA